MCIGFKHEPAMYSILLVQSEQQVFLKIRFVPVLQCPTDICRHDSQLCALSCERVELPYILEIYTDSVERSEGEGFIYLLV